MRGSDLSVLMSDNRSDLQTRWPLAVAAFEYVLTGLQKLDASVPGHITVKFSYIALMP